MATPKAEAKPNGALDSGDGGKVPPTFVADASDEEPPRRENVFSDLKEHMLDLDDTEPVTEELLTTVPIRKPSKRSLCEPTNRIVSRRSCGKTMTRATPITSIPISAPCSSKPRDIARFTSP